MKIPSFLVCGLILSLPCGRVHGAVTLVAEQSAEISPTVRSLIARGVPVTSDKAGERMAVNAFDGFIHTSWTTTTAAGEKAWLEYHFDHGVRWVLAEYSVVNGGRTSAQDPREWELHASNDGVEWHILDTRKDPKFFGRRNAVNCKVELSEAYSRYRVVFTATDAETTWEISEIGFKVKALAPPPESPAIENERGCTMLSWMPVDKATGYSVWRAGALKGPYRLLVAGVTETYFKDLGPYEDADISYYAVSTDVGAVQGAISTPAGVTTQVAAPAQVKAVLGKGAVTLEWSPAPRAVAYVVRRALAAEGPYTDIASQITAPAYTDEGLSVGTAYYYVVSGVANGKEGAASAPVGALFPPLAPTGLASVPGKETVALSWNPVALAKAYKITRAESAEGPEEDVATVTEGTTYTDKVGKAIKTWHYTVYAVNDCGTSVASARVEGAAIRPAAWWRR